MLCITQVCAGNMPTTAYNGEREDHLEHAMTRDKHTSKLLCPNEQRIQ